MKRFAVIILLSLFALTGCGAQSVGSTAAPSPTTSAPGPGQSLQPDPALREAQSPEPDFDYGYLVQITSSGLRPKTLLSGCCLPITWRNLTSETVSIVFDYQKVDSGPIAPGGAWVFKPHNTESVLYHTGQGPPLQGSLQIQQSFES